MVITILLCTLALVGAEAAGSVSTGRCVVVRDAATGQDVRIEPFGRNAVRVRAVPSGRAIRDDLVSALLPPADGFAAAPGSCTWVTLAGQSVTSGNLRAQLGADGRLSFTRVHDSKLLLSEASPRSLAPTVTTPPLSGFLGLNVTFEAVPGERIYGMGQHKTGILDNKKMGKLSLAPRNTEILIPVAHSSQGYAFLMNLPGFGSVEFGDDQTSWKLDTVLQADFWVATTDPPPPAAAAVGEVSPWAQLQHSYANATGHSPVYPQWTSGYWQCKNRYHNQTQVMDVARGYSSRGYPISLIIIDYFSWAPGPLGDERLPSQCWPDPAGMVAELKAMGVEVMLSPYFHEVTEDSKRYPLAAKKGYLALDPSTKQPAKVAYSSGYIYDLFQEEARQYAWSAVEQGYIQPYKLHHWWLDCDEPCGGDGISELLYNNGSWPASFVGAAYPHMVDKMVWEGTTKDNPTLDNVMLGRSAWAGSQRYGGAVWSGDTSSNFENLNQQFRAGLNLVMSGIPYWTTDIGGYNGGNISSPGFRELIVRWFSWGAFCPIFRSHGRRSGGAAPATDGGQCGRTGSGNEIWEFGPEAEAAIARIMRVREQLRPYIMEQYQTAAETGTPIMRPLFYDFWNDEKAELVEDQLMFGPDYLVAPQLKEASASRFVYLPQLAPPFVWQGYFDGVLYNTTQHALNISVPTPLDGTLPLFRRHRAVCYPKPLPPPPPPHPNPPVQCGASCTEHSNTDKVGSGHLAEAKCATFADCCSLCKQHAYCGSFVWGPKNSGDNPSASNPNICFMLSATNLTRPASNRAFGCLSSAQ